MLLGRDWAVRELNEMITWQKNEDSKQCSLGKEYLVNLFKPELSLFVVNCLSEKAYTKDSWRKGFFY